MKEQHLLEKAMDMMNELYLDSPIGKGILENYTDAVSTIARVKAQLKVIIELLDDVNEEN